MARRYVEERHEAQLQKRVVDVRPAGAQYAEWLGEKFNLMMVVVPQIVLAISIPFLAPFLFLSVAIHILVHRTTRPILPFRYPAGNKDRDHKGKKGDGILLLGLVDSDSEYERFKEIWQSDDDLRKHMLIIGSTGSGKSETLKGIFFNALCWSSGFFVADGKADNKLPTDTFTMANSFGRGLDLLFLNFLLGGKSPEQVRKSRRRRSNKINPVSSADADTIIQMGANMLPKVEGEGKNWQEKALNLWRAEIQALCYLRDNEGLDLSVSTIIDYMALPKIEELYMWGYEESLRRQGEWSYGFAAIKAYLESGCPAYKIDKLLAKHGYGDAPQPPPGRPGMGGGKQFEQDSMAYEQHAYRSSQLMPVLNLLDKTYGYIFRDKYPEIDMIDVTLNNRILVLLIPSLEKSSQEAENLGKLNIACLRVMMGQNLGAEIEGTRQELISSKATAAPYPYLVALDELAYYFSDGIAVMFAQARSLGFCMIAAAQDLEKLTEGNRAAEAGAMLANQVAKFFMRIDDAGKTYEFINKILGKVSVAVRRTFETANMGYKRSSEIDVQEVERVSLKEMQTKTAGEAVFNSAGKTVRANSLYVGKDLEIHANNDFHVNRFLQVEPPSAAEIDAFSIPMDRLDNSVERASRMLSILRYERSRTGQVPEIDSVIEAVSATADSIEEGAKHTKAAQRAIALYQAARCAVLALEQANSGVGIQAGPGGSEVDPAEPATVAGVDDGSDASGQAMAQDKAGNPLAVDRQSPAQDKLGDLFGSFGMPMPAPAQPASAAPGRRTAPDIPLTEYPDASTVASKQQRPADMPPDDEDEGLDVLAFMGGPFERKPAHLLLAQQEADVLREESGAFEDSALHDGSEAVSSFIRAGRTLNLYSEGPELPYAEAATLTALAGVKAPPDAAGDMDWVSSAVSMARRIVADRSARGQSMVGFTKDATKGTIGVESALGSPAPELAAARLETVVASKVTPNLKFAAELEDDDVNAFFDRLGSAGEHG